MTVVPHSPAFALLDQAKTAVRHHHFDQARRLLHQAVELEPTNHTLWLWLARCAPTASQALSYLARAEQLQPSDPRVPKMHDWIKKRFSPTVQETAASLPQTPNTQRRRPTILFIMALLLLFPLGIAGWSQLGNPFATASAAPTPAAALVQPLPSATVPAPTATPTAVQIAAKPVSSQSDSDPAPTWTITPTPSPTPTPTPTILPTFVSSSAYTSNIRPSGVEADERWIDVNLTTQVLTAYEGDTAVFSTYISSGTWDHPTVVGQFRVWHRTRSQTMDGTRLGYDYYLENVPYVMYFFEDYAIHGTYWHSNFGTPMSHGCVNMETSEARWLYEWASLGTLVNVHY